MIKNEYWKKLKNAFFSVLPIAVIVLVLLVTICDISTYDLIKFIVSMIMLIFGISFFTLGTENSMLPMGEAIGNSLSKVRKLWVFIFSAVILGFVITIAEPSLFVLSAQLISINKWLFICAVSIGTAVSLGIGVLRIIFAIKLNYVLWLSYALVFILLIFTPQSFLSVCFDAGSVTTGAVSMPFILAFGVGVSKVRSENNSEDNSFGLVALASVGPIISTLILGMFLGDSSQAISSATTITESGTISSFFGALGTSLLKSSIEVTLILLIIALVFLCFNKKMLHLPKIMLKKYLFNLFITLVGIIIFISGSEFGLLPVSSILGYSLQTNGNLVFTCVIAIVAGFCLSFAEPTLIIMGKQIEDITNGSIKRRLIIIVVSMGVAVATLIGVLRVLLGISYLWLILPLYAVIAILLAFCPTKFSAIAFDCGGVITGTMATCFVLPFVMGICTGMGTDLMIGAFGTLSFIAAVPILAIEIFGIIYAIMERKQKNKVDRRLTKRINLLSKTNISLLITIIERDKGDEVARLISELCPTHSYVTIAHGTIEDFSSGLFGFDLAERDVVFSIIEDNKTKTILSEISEKFEFDKDKHTGISIVIDISAIEKKGLELLDTAKEGKNEKGI